jgi:HlyD family secretion protein
MKKKWIFILSGLVLAVIAGFSAYSRLNTGDEEQLFSVVKKGDFEVLISTTGELQAKNSEDILGPSTMRNSGVWNVKISDIVPEGTEVKAGDYIATLDRAEAAGKLKDIESELQKIESQYTQTRLDTTLQLRTSRDDLINLGYSLEEKKLTLSQSKFEPPAVVRQAEIDVEKAERAYRQSKENYQIKKQQLAAKMQEVSATLAIQKNKHDQILSLLDQFVIKAPKSGMVIYVKEWNGKKKTVGSSISPWELAVATLPDLSVMITQTYVNEVDISKIKVGQEVKVGVDAFPEKSFTGKVISVANVGEQRPNTDAKVFEVKIMLNEKDPILRPAMTTSNMIKAATIKQVLFVPLECIHAADSTTYVFVKDGFRIRKQEVRTGISNSNEIVIEKGLKEGDALCLSTPKNASDIAIERLPEEKTKPVAKK